MNGKKDSILLNVSTTNLNVLKTHDFAVQYSNLALDINKNYQVALISYSLYYSWYNIFAGVNNKFQYSPDGGANYYAVFLTAGNYGIDNINTEIKRLVTANGHNADNISIVGNFTTLKVDITLSNNYFVDMGLADGLNTILGFSSQVITLQGTTSGDLKPNVSNNVDAVQIHSSIVDFKSNLTNDAFSTCLHQFVPKASVGSNLANEISSPIYLPLSVNGKINNIYYSIRDQTGNLLDLNDESVNLSLHIMEI
jgi:hypothetical protein